MDFVVNKKLKATSAKRPRRDHLHNGLLASTLNELIWSPSYVLVVETSAAYKVWGEQAFQFLHRNRKGWLWNNFFTFSLEVIPWTWFGRQFPLAFDYYECYVVGISLKLFFASIPFVYTAKGQSWKPFQSLAFDFVPIDCRAKLKLGGSST